MKKATTPGPLQGKPQPVPFLGTIVQSTSESVCPRNGDLTAALTPFRTAVPFRGQITQNLSGLSPKRDCGSKGVNKKEVSRIAQDEKKIKIGHSRSRHIRTHVAWKTESGHFCEEMNGLRQHVIYTYPWRALTGGHS